MTGYNELRDGQEFYGNGYKKGYEDAKKEYARPQGKLKKLYGDKYYCSKCGKDCEQLYKRFCGYCGAELQ